MPRTKPNDGLTNRQRYHKNNPGAAAKAAKRYRKAHPDKARVSRSSWKKKHPERSKEIQKKANLNCTFGKGAFDHFEKQKRSQKGLCAICKKVLPKEAHSDHNHEINQWRGVLCGTCNRGLGYLKDSAVILKAAIAYLKKWETQWKRNTSFAPKA